MEELSLSASTALLQHIHIKRMPPPHPHTPPQDRQNHTRTERHTLPQLRAHIYSYSQSLYHCPGTDTASNSLHQTCIHVAQLNHIHDLKFYWKHKNTCSEAITTLFKYTLCHVALATVELIHSIFAWRKCHTMQMSTKLSLSNTHTHCLFLGCLASQQHAECISGMHIHIHTQ